MKPWKKGARETGKYRNLFLEADYTSAEIDTKMEKAYYDVFEGPGRVYFEVGDSMAYVSDLKNHDARTEGLSYNMMVAVQVNKKDVFDRLWHWTVKYMQHKGGARDAYFAWSVNPKTGKHNAEGSRISFSAVGLSRLKISSIQTGCFPHSFFLPAGGYQKLSHSLGLVSTSAAASLMGPQAKSWKFVDAVWNARLEPYADGYFDSYYDGLLYLFSIMHLCGNYCIITPGMN